MYRWRHVAATAAVVRCSVVVTQTFKLPLRVVQFAFQRMEHERDVDEIECLLANLIFRVSVDPYSSTLGLLYFSINGGYIRA